MTCTPAVRGLMNNAARDLRVGFALVEQPQHVQLPVGQPERASGRRLLLLDGCGGRAQVDAGAAGEILDRRRQRHVLRRLNRRCA